MTKRREFHDLANIFPMLAGDEAKALAHDILEHGLREPITLLEGKILDGRNRYIACLDAGVESRFTPYKGDNPAAYVVSLNLKRRHLDESQRAMVAKKLATLELGQRQTGKFAGVTTQAEAASMLNVSERSVRTAGAVIDKAVPEIVTAVEKGDVSVSAAAQFAKQPKEEQAKQIAESETPANAVKAFRDSRKIRSAEAVGDDGPPEHASALAEPVDNRQLIEVSEATELPPVGTWVIYVSRPGEGRAGKSEFPALVMHHEYDGTLNLMVVYDVDDMCIRPHVQPMSELLMWPAWRPLAINVRALEEPSEPSRLNRMASELEHVRADLDRTRAAIYGEYEDPGRAIMEIMVSFEQKLKDLTKRIKDLEARAAP